ncbi:hypothetical protein [Cystobacter ferrugineus]|uniref:hypothetical protein n=1 Tax=Cystobacter ferrugineus TaxID=83449 RepID=UPI000AAEC41B|nr:hypothetical protein [Cystobacter ferrugineus]
MSVSDVQIFEARLDGVQQAASRARGVFLAVTVIASTTIASSFSMYFSWLRNLIKVVPGGILTKENLANGSLAVESTFKRVLEESLVRGWVDSAFVTVPGLGAKFAIVDAAVWATGGLLISALWLFFCLRRENHLIGYVLTDAYDLKDKIPGIYPLVVHSVRASQVFATGSARNKSFSSMNDVKAVKEKPQQGDSVLEAIPRGVMVFLMGLPALGCFCVLFCDFLSVFYVPALFRGSSDPIGWENVKGSPQFWLMIGFNVLMLLSCFLLGVLAGRYQLATRKLVSETVGILRGLESSSLAHLPLSQAEDNQQGLPSSVVGEKSAMK